MLKPKYLEQLPLPMIELYSQAEQDILADMARRISTYDYWIPAADWQYQKLVEMGNFHSYIMEALSARTGKSRKELERLMEEAGAKTLAFDTAIYKAHGLSPPPLAESETLRAVLSDGLRKTGGLFDNLTATTADTATRQFEHALDRAWLQITSGGFGRNAAIRTAVKDLARDGVKSITYPSGHTDTLEVAVRRAVVTGVNQCALRLQGTLADEMGCDLVETTAHSGARPSHAEWQGRVFSRSGKSKEYPSFVKATGYGTGDGLGGWNCRHGFFPYFEGSPRTYTQKQLDALEEKTVTYNGQKLTEYEASQQQRYIERQIRRWKRESVAMQAAGMDTAESAAKIHQWQETQKDFVRQTGLKRQGDREQVAEFGRKESAKTSVAVRPVIKFDKMHLAQSERELLQNHESAQIPDAKLSGYALNMDHPVGKHKAIAFQKALGYTIDNKQLLISQVRRGLKKYRATERTNTKYGWPFEVPMMLLGANGKHAKIITAWIIDTGKTEPRLTSIYVDE